MPRRKPKPATSQATVFHFTPNHTTSFGRTRACVTGHEVNPDGTERTDLGISAALTGTGMEEILAEGRVYRITIEEV